MTHASQPLEADYLIVGAGAMGLAFADVLASNSRATAIIVDRHDQPGGHWNDAYPFVRLHSASANYGVNSTPLGAERIDHTGLNRGFFEHASAAELLAYFDRVMRERLLASGRVRYFPMCDYRGDGRFVSLVTGVEQRVTVRRKVVDATFTDTATPSRTPPKYDVAPDVSLIAPNALPLLNRVYRRYTVVGAGKTGIDVCLWLLQHGVAPERIAWIMPRDSWLLDRAHVQPRAAFFAQRMGSLATQVELIQQAESAEHLFQLLSRHGQLLRVDERVTPQRYRCATVSQAELAQLRRIANIVRMGHVNRIEADRLMLDGGELPSDRDTLYIDCTAGGIRTRTPVPVFADGVITLQAIRTCQQCFSSALIAVIELTYDNDALKNQLTTPIPLPNVDIDWLKMFAINLRNQQRWLSRPELREWIARSRLDLSSGRSTPLTSDEAALTHRFREGAGRVGAKLAQLSCAFTTA